MDDDDLLTQLRIARDLGFLGPGPVEDHVHHAQAFVGALAGTTGHVIDLGAGGGVPGLVIARARADLQIILLDAMAKRCQFLEQAVRALGLHHVEVLHARAETAGRGPLRGQAAAVVARGFGPPAVTAECAAPFLAVGGIVIVSEPPDGSDRWPAGPLAELGLEPSYRSAAPPYLQVLRQVAPCPERYPRRDGVPAKRPLF